jgi:hypothetical protein
VRSLRGVGSMLIFYSPNRGEGTPRQPCAPNFLEPRKTEGQLRRKHPSRTSGDNERLGPPLQNTMTSGVRFRAELSEDGVRRLELARALRALRARLHSLGYAVTYPTKYKRSRTAFPRSALQGKHATIRSSEGLRIGHRPRHRFIRNPEADA